MYKHTQHSFAGGQLDPHLMGRQDLAKYFTGASVLKNLLVRRQGCLAKRRGTDVVADLSGLLGREDGGTGSVRPLGRHRLVPIVKGRDRGYYALLADRRAFLIDPSRGIFCSDGVWRTSAPAYAAPDMNAAAAAQGSVSFDDTHPVRIGTDGYDTLTAAVNSFGTGAAQTPYGSTIVLNTDITLSSSLTVRGKIDLNGHSITFTGASQSITFNPGHGIECGIVSSRRGARLAWADGVNPTAAAIRHQTGKMELSDFEAAFPSSSTNSGCALVSSETGTSGNDADTLVMLRCVLSASCLGGVVRLSGTSANAAQADTQDSRNTKAGILIDGCDIAYAYTASSTEAFAVRNMTVNSATARRVTIASGHLSCPGHAASNLGLRVLGGRFDCTAIGTVTSTTYPVSKITQGMCTADVASGFIESGTVKSEATLSYDGTDFFSYAPAASYVVDGETDLATPAYTEAENVWPAASFVNDNGASAQASVASSSSLTQGSAPYCIKTPYADNELEDIDWCQSGAVVFFAHRKHRPAMLTFDPAAPSLSFSDIVFNSQEWSRPLITGVSVNVNQPKDEFQTSGTTTYKTSTTYNIASATKTVTVTTGGTVKAQSVANMQSRTVKYAVTYVKDGIESRPSLPVEATYLSPWEEGGTIRLMFAKGSNDTEPDWYNIYKMESTDYGLIGRTPRPITVSVEPSLVCGVADGSILSPGRLPSVAFNGAAMIVTECLDITGAERSDVYAGDAVTVEGTFGTYDIYTGSGGIRFGTDARALLEFGGESCVIANKLIVAFDTHSLAYEEVTDVNDPDFGKVRVFDDAVLSGKTVTVTVWHEPTSGGDRSRAAAVATATLSAFCYVDAVGSTRSAYTGAVRRSCGVIAPGAQSAAARSAAQKPLRTAEFTFSALDSGKRQIARIAIDCVDENGDPCEVAVAAIALKKVNTGEKSFVDDYITPDMSLTPPEDADSFAAKGDYPSCVGLYQQRLVFASSDNRPFGFWMSAVGNLYDFAGHPSIRDDDPLSGELAATEFPDINHIVASRDLVMFADGGEWRIAPTSGNTLTYKTISATIQSAIGSARWLKPIAIGNEAVFAERSGRTLRSVSYSYASDGYESQDLSVLSASIFTGNPIRRMCYKQHPDSTIVCVLRDGSLATLAYMREHEVIAWSKHVLGGTFRAEDAATCKALEDNTTGVLLSVRATDGHLELWSVRPDDPAATVSAQACMDGCRMLTGADAAAAWQAGWTAIDILTAETYQSKAALQAASSYASRRYLCGFTFETELATVRPEPQGQTTIQFEIKNAKDAEVRVLESGPWRAAPIGRADDPVYAQIADAPVSATDGAISLDTSDHTLLLSGDNSGDGRVQVKSNAPWPLNILSVSVNYEIEPLSNQKG